MTSERVVGDDKSKDCREIKSRQILRGWQMDKCGKSEDSVDRCQGSKTKKKRKSTPTKPNRTTPRLDAQTIAARARVTNHTAFGAAATAASYRLPSALCLVALFAFFAFCAFPELRLNITLNRRRRLHLYPAVSVGLAPLTPPSLDRSDCSTSPALSHSSTNILHTDP